jgi:hypothetical protein
MASLDTISYPVGGLQSFSYSQAAPLGGLRLFRYGLAWGTLQQQAFTYDLVAGPPCWESRAQRLLDYLCPQVFKAVGDTGSLLHQVMSMVARELSGCTEVVTYAGEDARGDGNFHVHTRFGEIQTVASVARVDANGNVLENYTVVSTDGEKTITVSGVVAPRAGDHLAITYTYLHKGLEVSVRDALLQLNILTSNGDFLDEWGRWFGVPRQNTGTYGSDTYGGGIYGTTGTEDDAPYSRRIIDRVLQSRNTKVAIINAVKTVTGGSPYIVEWIDPATPVGFIFNVTGQPTWSGGETAVALSKHLIMGRTARFRNGATPGGGAYVFEVWVPQGSGYSAPRLLEIVNAYRAAGTKAYIRFQGT